MKKIISFVLISFPLFLFSQKEEVVYQIVKEKNPYFYYYKDSLSKKTLDIVRPNTARQLILQNIDWFQFNAVPTYLLDSLKLLRKEYRNTDDSLFMKTCILSSSVFGQFKKEEIDIDKYLELCKEVVEYTKYDSVIMEIKGTWKSPQTLLKKWKLCKYYCCLNLAYHSLERQEYWEALGYTILLKEKYKLHHPCANGIWEQTAMIDEYITKSYAGLGNFDSLLQYSIGIVTNMANTIPDNESTDNFKPVYSTFYPYSPAFYDFFVTEFKKHYSPSEIKALMEDTYESINCEYKYNGIVLNCDSEFLGHKIIFYNIKKGKGKNKLTKEEVEAQVKDQFLKSYLYLSLFRQ